MPCRDEDTERLARKLATNKRHYENLRQGFDQALLQLQRKQEKAHRDERRELLSGSDAGATQRKLQTEADIVGEAKGATDSLKRTRMLMAQVC